MVTIDIIVIALLAIVAVVNFFGGFHKGPLNNIFTIVRLAGVVLLAPIIVKELKSIDAIASMITPIGASIDGIIKGMGDTIVTVIFYVIAALALFIVLGILLGILKWLLRYQFDPKREPATYVVIIDKVLGVVFSVAIYGAIILAILALLGNLGIPAIDGLLEGSKICEINPLNAIFAGMF